MSAPVTLVLQVPAHQTDVGTDTLIRDTLRKMTEKHTRCKKPFTAAFR